MRPLLALAIASLTACRREEPQVHADPFDAAPPQPSAVPAPRPSCPDESGRFARECLGDALAPAQSAARANCGPVSLTRLQITFAPTGTVAHVESEPKIPGTAGSCVHKAFSAARLPPFPAPSLSVGWRYQAP